MEVESWSFTGKLVPFKLSRSEVNYLTQSVLPLPSCAYPAASIVLTIRYNYSFIGSNTRFKRDHDAAAASEMQKHFCHLGEAEATWMQMSNAFLLALADGEVEVKQSGKQISSNAFLLVLAGGDAGV